MLGNLFWQWWLWYCTHAALQNAVAALVAGEADHPGVVDAVLLEDVVGSAVEASVVVLRVGEVGSEQEALAAVAVVAAASVEVTVDGAGEPHAAEVASAARNQNSGLVLYPIVYCSAVWISHVSNVSFRFVSTALSLCDFRHVRSRAMQ